MGFFDVLGGAVGGLFGGIGSIISGNAANNANRQIAAQTNKTNLQIARENNEFNKNMYYEDREYNSPEQQAARLKSLGMSDSAIAQSVGNFQQSVPQASELGAQQMGAPMQPLDFSGLSGVNIIGAAREAAALKKEKAEASIAEQTAELTTPSILSVNDARDAATKKVIQDTKQAQELFPYSLQAQKFSTEKLGNWKQEFELYKRQADVNYDIAKQKFDFLTKWNDEQLQKVQAEIREIGKRIENLDTQNDVNRSIAEVNRDRVKEINAQTGKIVQETETEKQRTKQVELENAIKDCDRILKENGAPEDFTRQVGLMLASGKTNFDMVANGLWAGRNYIEYGYKSFQSDRYMRDYLLNFIDEGNAHINDFGMEQRGYVSSMADRLTCGWSSDKLHGVVK